MVVNICWGRTRVSEATIYHRINYNAGSGVSLIAEILKIRTLADPLTASESRVLPLDELTRLCHHSS
jgi:hypothetical protein